jgi:UPF0755 protein
MTMHDRGVFPFQGLGGALEEEPPPRSGPGRHRRHRPGAEGGERRRSVVAFAALLSVFAVVVVGGWMGYGKAKDFFVAPDYPGPGVGEVTVAIESGQTATAIGATLTHAGVVKSTDAFADAAKANPDSRRLEPGTYVLRKEMRASDALLLLLNPASRVFKRVTVPEGKTVIQTLKLVAAETGLSLTSLQDAAKDPAGLGVPDWNKASPTDPQPQLEGFLFPATYDLQPSTTARELLAMMVHKAVSVLESIQFEQQAQQHNLSVREVLIVASLLEGEGIPSDFGKIARVVYNRLEAQMPLQYDSTTNYGRELAGQPRVERPTAVQLEDPTNLYSTASRRGLPPGPISNPGKDALRAATTPESGPWLYFVRIDTQGNSAFAVTLSEHEANIQRGKANGAFK